jgi:lipid-binding SYLF domain-containing protein
MKNLYKVILISMLCIGVSISALAEDNDATKVQQTIQQFKNNRSVAPYFDKAYGYAVYPNIIKGGIIIGFGEGKGQVFQDGYFTGKSTLTSFSLGAQLGAQSYSEVIFFKNKVAYENFLTQGLIFSANASAALITLGANAQAGSGGVSSSASTGALASNTKPRMHGAYSNSIATFVLTKAGLMGQATLGGETFTFTPKSSF